MKTTKYDYSKYDGIEETWDYDILKNEDFFGVHMINSRLEIDVERYKKACKIVGIEDFIPELFKNSEVKYYMPSRQNRDDYIVNIYIDSLNELMSDWNNEYKPIFSKIKTPHEVKENYRLSSLMYTSNSDDFDEIDIESSLAGIKRTSTYNRIVNELYCIFVGKICTEVDRISLYAMTKSGYTDTDFSFKQFRAFSEGMLNGTECYKIEKLNKYNAYNMLHKLNNFLKHNSIDSYNTLKKFYPNNVRSVENKTAEFPYKNGIFASDWIILKENYIDEVLKKLIIFFSDYCEKFCKENQNRANWDYDDYFLNAIRQMSDPREYLGLYF